MFKWSIGGIWEVQFAVRSKKKRAMGGMLMGRRKNIQKKREDRKEKEEGVLAGKLRLTGKWWWLVEVYVNDLQEKLEIIRE